MKNYNAMPGHGQGISAESAVAVIGAALGGRPNGKGGFDLCVCPAHGGHNCLSVDVGNTGNILIHCHAGCEPRAILDAIRASGLPLPAPASSVFAQDRRRDKMTIGSGDCHCGKRVEARNAEVAKLARAWWNNSAPPSPKHPYLCAKDFTDWRFDLLALASPFRQDYRGCLVIPLFGAGGELVTVQRIDRRGGKYLFKGCRKKGTFHSIGIPAWPLVGHEGRVLLAEGWATAAELHLSTDLPSIMTVDAGNMPEVARIVRKLAPAADIILCADEDPAGIDAATRAARAVGGKVARPRDSAAEAAWRKGYDFWDLWRSRGASGVIAAVRGARPC